MASPDVKKRLVNQVFDQIEQQYAQLQKDEAAELHNAFAGIIEELKPSSTNTLLVLELLKQEVLNSLIGKFEEIKATPPKAPTEESGG